MRKYAREVAFSLIYTFLITEENADVSFELFDAKKLDDEDKEYVVQTYIGTLDHVDEIKESVSKYSVGFTVERIYKIDLAIITLAVYEIKYSDIPKAVCVNEAVELAKKFSTEKSVSFVNGLLAEYIKNI